MPPTIAFDLQERAAHVADERWNSWVGPICAADVTTELLERAQLGHYRLTTSAPSLAAAELGLGVLEAGLAMRFGARVGDDSHVLHVVGDPDEVDGWARSWGFPT